MTIETIRAGADPEALLQDTKKNRTRFSGILVHPTSFPSPYGIGDLGKGAYDFIDFLEKTGQTLWQVLPLGPTGFGDSPYQGPSAFAGQPLLISPEKLREKGLLSEEDLRDIPEWNPRKVDYGPAIQYKTTLLKKAFETFAHTPDKLMLEEFEYFCAQEKDWLEDYALFMALKEAHEGRCWLDWEPSLRTLSAKEKDTQRQKYAEEVRYFCFVQFMFQVQWTELLSYAHEHGVKVYVTVNILAHNEDLEKADDYLAFLGQLEPDALLIADPGLFMRAKTVCPKIPVHISTQANNVNYETFLFWHRLGAERVVCGRELSLAEIHQIRTRIPDSLEIEAFVHGAMCISYSGRCLLSNFFTGRDANRGACTHPCRWQYHVVDGPFPGRPGEDPESGSSSVTASISGDRAASSGEILAYIEEESRPGERLPVCENERGTYIFNSKDLCMIEHIPDMIEAGIDSLKIEGRMKNALYVATTARTYRRALDDLGRGREVYEGAMEWYRKQIRDCTFRPFTTGFFYGKPGEDAQIYDSNTYEKTSTYLGCVQDIVQIGEYRYIEIVQKNKFCVGETVQLMHPDGEDTEFVIEEILDEDGKQVPDAPHPQRRLYVRTEADAERYDILRRREVQPE